MDLVEADVRMAVRRRAEETLVAWGFAVPALRQSDGRMLRLYASLESPIASPHNDECLEVIAVLAYLAQSNRAIRSSPHMRSGRQSYAPAKLGFRVN